MVDIAFFGKQVPLAGQRKPRSQSRVTKLLQPNLERLSDGRYLHTVTMQNRCCNTIEVGARQVYVMDDFGYPVLVEEWGHSWY